MNVLELMANTLAKQMAEQGPEMLARLVENLPPDILDSVGQIKDVLLSFKAQLDRIESQNRLIIAHLNIPAATDLTEHERHGKPQRLFEDQ